jgi:hypothetical protein
MKLPKRRAKTSVEDKRHKLFGQKKFTEVVDKFYYGSICITDPKV